jgi:hypothetical protein
VRKISHSALLQKLISRFTAYYHERCVVLKLQSRAAKWTRPACGGKAKHFAWILLFLRRLRPFAAKLHVVKQTHKVCKQ